MPNDAVRPALDEGRALVGPRERSQFSPVRATSGNRYRSTHKRDEDAEDDEQPPARPTWSEDACTEDRSHERELEDDPATSALAELRNLTQA